MAVLTDIVGKELLEPEFLAAVIRRLQVEDMPVEERERLLKQWAARVGRTLPEWALASMALPPMELM